MTPERYEKICELFFKTVEMEPDLRKSFLEEKCADDPSLGGEVEKLLANDRREQEDSIFPEPAKVPWIPEPPDPMIGRRIGPYEIIRIIDDGGMGVVYLAIQREPFTRRVAIKFIKPGLDSQSNLQRFCNERQILAALQHPNIATVLDGGTTEDGRPYFVMEYIEGKRIDTYCNEKRLNTRQRLTLFMDVCSAVHFTHQHGVIHRDLSPDNIHVTEEGKPKLLDFGIAKLANPSLGFAQDDGKTKPVDQFLKRDYASPEQVRGDPVTAASDIYSLGVVLYRLLTGHPPYHFQSHSPDVIRDTICDTQPQRPSTIIMHSGDCTPKRVTPEEVSKVRDGDLDKLHRSLYGEVDNIVLMALKKEADRRFMSAEHFREDIERHLKGLPLMWAEKDTLVYRIRKFIQRYRPLVALVVLIVLSLLGGIIGTTTALFRAWDAENEANQRTEDANEARAVAIAEQEKTQRELAGQLLQTALVQCGRGEIGQGMLLLIEALDAAALGKASELEHVIRVNLAAWHPHLARILPSLQHSPGTVTVAFSPDGKYALTGGTDGIARLWDLADAREVHPLDGHRGAVQAVAFSPDSLFALTGSKDGTARLWRLADGKEIDKLTSHGGVVYAVAFSPKGLHALTGGADENGNGIARLWDLTNKRQIRELKHGGRVNTLAFSPSDDQIILTGSEDTYAQLWNYASGESQKLKHSGPVRAVAFSPSDGKTFVTAGVFEARLWKILDTGRPEKISSFPQQGFVNAVAFRPDGKALLMGSTDGFARFWDCEERKPLGRPLWHRGEVNAVAFHPSENLVMTGARDGVARLWKARPASFPLQSLPHPGMVHAVAFHPSGEAVLTGVRVSLMSGFACISDLVTKKQLWFPASPHQGAVRAVAYSCDGKLILSGSEDGVLRLWEAVGNGKPRSWNAHDSVVNSVAFAPNGQTVLSGSSDGTAALWRVADGKKLHRLWHDARGHVWNAAFNPSDGQTVLTASEDGTVRLWDANNGNELSQSPRLPRGEGVRAAVFSPDGKTILTGSTDGKVRIWHPNTGATVELGSHFDKVVAMAFSPDGKTALSGSMDGYARLYDTKQGKPIGHRLWHGANVTALAFSPDGRTVLTATGGADCAAYFWDAATGWQLGPRLPHSNRVQAVAFRRDGMMAVTGSQDRTARLWKVPAEQAGTREQIRLWVQVATGMELDENSDPRELTIDTWRQLRRSEQLQPRLER